MATAKAKLKKQKTLKKKKVRPVDYTLEDFVLRAPRSKKFDADIAGSLVTADLELTIEGASTLTMTIEDPDYRLLFSETLTHWAVSKKKKKKRESQWLRSGHAVDAAIDDIFFRLVKVSKQETKLTLTFEERAVSLLRNKRGARTMSRASGTRAQFIQQLAREVKTKEKRISFHSPEKAKKQPIGVTKSDNEPDADETRDSGGSGFGKGADIKIQKVKATSEQLKNITICFGVAEKVGANPRAVKAMLCAGIQESTFRAIPNAGGSPYAGVFQALPANIPMKDTAKQCEYFFKGGKGFQAGGAIALSREQPGLSAGEIALQVEASKVAVSEYSQWESEADQIMDSWSGGGFSGDTGGTSAGSSRKSYQFSRGKKENSWDAIQRLAEEVGWRAFMRQGKLWYVSEEFLFRQRYELKISERHTAVDWINFDIDMYARPARKGTPAVAEMTVQARAERWSALPGMVVAVEDMGPADGRWLVTNVSRSLVDDAMSCDITLRKPVSSKKEPAAESTSGGATGDAPTGADGETGNVSGDIGGVIDELKEFMGLVAGATTETINISDGKATGGHVPDSDHYKGRAVDIEVGGDCRSNSAAGSKGNNIAAAALKVCGVGTHAAQQIAAGDEQLDFTKHQQKWKSHTIVIGWRTTTGGNHYNHVHISLRN